LVLKWLKRGAIAIAGLGVSGVLLYSWLPAPVEVDTTVARRGALDVEVDEDGLTRVHDRFVVAAPISGHLERIGLEIGAAVRTGDPVARVEPPDPALLDDRSRSEATSRLAGAIAQQRRANAAVARAVVARDAAVREAGRTRTLAERGAVAISEREHAEDQVQLATRDVAASEAERASAIAGVAAARAVLGEGPALGGRAVIVSAPVTGNVLKVLRDSAGPVAAGTPLVELGDIGTIEVVIDVLSIDAARIAPGMPVTIEAWGGERPLHARVRLVEPSGFTRISALGVEEQRVNVIVALLETPPTLGDGFRIEARIVTWHGDDVLTVPAGAVFRDRDRWAVYAIEDGHARLRYVELGHRGRLDVEITAGLRSTDVVILHPSDRVVDGIKIAARSS
jgi:HlyD family secretion protein